MLETKNIEMVECPKCHKKHFMKTGTSSSGSFFDCLSGIGFNDCVFRAPAKEIYLNGKLQNPEAFVPDPTKVYFECLECGCHFSVKTTYIWTGEGTTSATEIIDEDLEKEKREAAWKAGQEKREAERKKREAEHDKQLTDITLNDATSLTTSGYINNTIKQLSTDLISVLGNGTASEMDLGGLVIKSDRHFTDEQIKNIKETFGFEVRNIE